MKPRMTNPPGGSNTVFTIRVALRWLMSLATVLFLIQNLVPDLDVARLVGFERAGFLNRNPDRESYKQTTRVKVNALVTAKPKSISRRVSEGDVTLTKIAERIMASMKSKRHPKTRRDEKNEYRESGVVYL